jgi:hypothetical protein
VDNEKRRELEIFLALDVTEKTLFRDVENLPLLVLDNRGYTVLFTPTTNLNQAFELLDSPHILDFEMNSSKRGIDFTLYVTDMVPYEADHTEPALAICLAVAKAYGWEG